MSGFTRLCSDVFTGRLKSMINYLAQVLPTKGERIVLGVSGVGGALVSHALGGFDEAIVWLFTFVLIDYFTGFVGAIKTGTLNSRTGFAGLCKKACIFVIVAMCHGMDVMLNTDSLRDGAIIAFAVNEFVSVIENFEKCGLGYLIPIPIRNALEQIKERDVIQK